MPLAVASDALTRVVPSLDLLPMTSTVLAHREQRMISTVVYSCGVRSIEVRGEELNEDLEEEEDEDEDEDEDEELDGRPKGILMCS